MYIIKTTHWSNSQYMEDKKAWTKDILEFCKTTQFVKLEVLDYSYNTVIFKAHTEQGVLYEKSQFDLVDGKWYYVDGDIYS
jgi:SEC-C motif-containing protein